MEERASKPESHGEEEKLALRMRTGYIKLDSLFGNDNIEAIIEHGLLLLQTAVGLFYRKVEGDDEYPQAEDDSENGNMEEKV